MNRSKKKRPFFAPAKNRHESDKKDKRLTHKLFRHRENTLIGKGEHEILPLRHDELFSEWDFASDGPKIYHDDATQKMMRK
jgi:hypothetical protein